MAIAVCGCYILYTRSVKSLSHTHKQTFHPTNIPSPTPLYYYYHSPIDDDNYLKIHPPPRRDTYCTIVHSRVRVTWIRPSPRASREWVQATIYVKNKKSVSQSVTRQYLYIFTHCKTCSLLPIYWPPVSCDSVRVWGIQDAWQCNENYNVHHWRRNADAPSQCTEWHHHDLSNEEKTTTHPTTNCSFPSRCVTAPAPCRVDWWPANLPIHTYI
jgi:hypothetical protein